MYKIKGKIDTTNASAFEKELMEKYPLKAWNCNLKEGMFLGKVTNGASIMGRGYFILEASSPFELDGYCDDIKSEFELEGKG